jgi:1-hydroxycarotenoid 3,4-desaturase
MRDPAVIVVGAGIGGLVTALDLAARGLSVHVLDAAPRPGGKMRQVSVGTAAPMDAGPTVFTMRWVFEALYAHAGERLDDQLVMHPFELLARHAWGDGSRLDLFADPVKSAQAISDFAGPAEAAGFMAFSRRARQIYETLEGPFLRATRPSLVTLAWRVSTQSIWGLGRISPFASMWGELEKYFNDPRLRQLFGRYATYCGSSPFQAPATLNLIAHVEQQGVWNIEGGMYALATNLEKLAAERGVVFQYGAHVIDIAVRNGRACGIRLASGEQLDGSAVVFNGDVAALSSGLLGSQAIRAVTRPSTARSMSAYTLNLVAQTSGLQLARHNVFLSQNYAAEFDALVGRGQLPSDPTVYICALDCLEGDASVSTGQPQRMLCVINAPAVGDRAEPDRANDYARYEAAIFDQLGRCGLKLTTDLASIVRTTPMDFHRMFPATGGALYGAPSHGWQASFARPGARSRLPGLYLAGGSVHPGPGVPMAALAGRNAAASVAADLTPQARKHRP